MRLSIISLVIAVLSITGSGMAHGGENQDNVYRASISADGIQRIEMLGGEYFFKPDHIIVKKDVPVELIIHKTSGIVPHDIVIHAPEAGIDIKESISTKPETIKFTPTKAGRYPFYCDKKLLFFKSHREKGMEGVLEVIVQ